MKFSQLVLSVIALVGLWRFICAALCFGLAVFFILLCIFMAAVTGN